MTLLVFAGLIVQSALKPPKSKYSSQYYDVALQANGDIEMNPKEGVAHETTIIFLHDYEDTNEDIFKMFADPYHGSSFA